MVLDIFKNAANLFDLNNPAAEKEIKGIIYKITIFADLAAKQKYYTLFAGNTKIEIFKSMQAAKDRIKNF